MKGAYCSGPLQISSNARLAARIVEGLRLHFLDRGDGLKAAGVSRDIANERLLVYAAFRLDHGERCVKITRTNMLEESLHCAFGSAGLCMRLSVLHRAQA